MLMQTILSIVRVFYSIRQNDNDFTACKISLGSMRTIHVRASEAIQDRTILHSKVADTAAIGDGPSFAIRLPHIDPLDYDIRSISKLRACMRPNSDIAK